MVEAYFPPVVDVDVSRPIATFSKEQGRLIAFS